MNERIQKLAAQAEIKWQHQEDVIHSTMTLEQFEKVAELIVLECARVARATPSPNFHEHLKQQLGHTWDMASVEAGKQIVKHFGVEE